MKYGECEVGSLISLEVGVAAEEDEDVAGSTLSLLDVLFEGELSRDRRLYL